MVLTSQLESVWPTGAAFLEGYAPQAEGPGKFHVVSERQEPHALGAVVSVLIRFLDREREAEFHVHARVVEKRGNGLRLEFLPEEKNREELVVACARGESVAYHRRSHPRIRCDLPARLTTTSGERMTARALLISARGLQIAVPAVPRCAIDDVVQLALEFDDGVHEMRARVAALVTEIQQPALGLEFLFDSAAQRDATADRVAVLAARMARRHL
jgi:hypothetical protein